MSRLREERKLSRQIVFGKFSKQLPSFLFSCCWTKSLAAGTRSVLSVLSPPWFSSCCMFKICHYARQSSKWTSTICGNHQLAEKMMPNNQRWILTFHLPLKHCTDNLKGLQIFTIVFQCFSHFSDVQFFGRSIFKEAQNYCAWINDWGSWATNIVLWF